MASDDQNIEFTTEIVANYVANNKVEASALPTLIRTVARALAQLGELEAVPEKTVNLPTAAQIKKSIRPEGLISFIDGKPYKTLKRHLAKRGLTFAEYRARYGLPDDYPATSPDYSARRSELAKQLGLGQRSKAVAAEATEPKRGRKPKDATSRSIGVS